MKLFGLHKSLTRQLMEFIPVAALLCLAVGCATPIGVSYVDRRVAYQSLTTNVLSTERMSSFSARELINFNVYQEFEDNPQKALADLHSGLAPTGDEERLFALAELSFLHAENSGERSYYLASAVYAYAFLYPGKQGTPPRGIDPRLRWAVDLYNQSLTQAAKSDEGAYAIPMGGKFKLPFGELTVEFNERDLIWGGFRMKDFVPAADIEVRGLRNRYRTPGIGAALAASIEPLEGASRQTVPAYSSPAKDPGHGVFAARRPTRGIGFGKVDAAIWNSTLRTPPERSRSKASKFRSNTKRLRPSP